MTGNRRGDFSRITFDPAKRYSGVVMQQGRVQLDADWNEQVDIVAHRLRTQAQDFIGPHGAPAGSSGFEIVPQASLRFDGKRRYLSLGHTGFEAYSASPALTIEARAKPRRGGAGGVVFCRFDSIDPDEPLQYSYMVSVLDDGRLRFDRAGGVKRQLISELPLASSRWSRIALHHDRSHCSLSIDGRPAGVLDEGFVRESRGAFFLVGLAHLEGEGPRGFDGSLSEIRLSGQAADSAGEQVLGWWRFDRGGGDVVLDLSGRGNHAILGGGRPEARPILELDELLSSAGRFYAGGALCENDRTVRLSEQVDLPGLELPADRAAGRAYLFYLDVWERTVTPVEEPALREPALGGADTATRSRIVAQTKWLPVELDAIPADPESGVVEWKRLVGEQCSRGRLQVRRPEASPGRLENRLYRIEVHGDGFKWSRDNGSVEAPVVAAEKGSPVVRIGSIGSGEPSVSPGDWLEILDRASALNGSAVKRNTLQKVVGFDEETRAVTLEQPLEASLETGASESRPVAVRWDGFCTSLASGDGDWHRLEHGIEARFLLERSEDSIETSDFRPGDYWTFAARTATGAIDWPVDAAGDPAALRPRGVDHHLSPLAVLRFDERGFELRDCRPKFEPLTTGAVSKAGDRMNGPLEIRPLVGAEANLAGSSAGDSGSESAPALLVAGTAQADTLLGALGSPGAVESFALADAAVTRSKISADVGTVPEGFAILGDSSAPPPGYEYTGSSMVFPNPDPQWVTRARLPVGEQPGELHSATVNGRVFTFSDTGRAWSYDPVDGTLEEHRPMPEPRGRFAAAAANGKVYLVGGVDHDGEKVAPTLEYDPTSDAWDWRRPMPTARCDVGLAEADGKLYAVGGLRDLLFLEVVSHRNEVYDPLVDHWTRRRSMPTARYALSAVGAASDGGGVFAFGGRRRWFLWWLGHSVSAVNEEYLPGVDRWGRRPNHLPAPRSEGATAVVGDAIFVVGGRSLFGWSSDMTSFAPRGDAWEAARPLTAPVISPGVASVDGRLVLHSAGETPGTLEVQECRIASSFHVHRKSATVEGDLEPQLAIPAKMRESLADLELPILRSSAPLPATTEDD